jgi:ribonuclease P protein component
MSAAEEDRTEQGHFTLPREARITTSAEIQLLFRRGKRSKTRHLDVFVSPSPASFPRIGFVVPKHRRNSVRRNLLKRRLREIARTEVLPRLRAAGRADDILVRARAEAYTAEYAALKSQLIQTVEKLCSSAS